jgi:ATP-dependent Clp protease ATP-binding subunit ClpC
VTAPPGQLAPAGRLVLEYAEQEALEGSLRWFGSGHVLLGLLRVEGSVGATVLQGLRLDTTHVRRQATELSASGPREDPAHRATPGVKRVLEQAFREAIFVGSRQVDTEHILIGFEADPAGSGSRILRGAGGNPEIIREAVRLEIRARSAARPARPGLAPNRLKTFAARGRSTAG